MPIWHALALTCNTIAQVSAKPQAVPIVDLPPAKTKTVVTFGGILGVHEAADGKLLVNDAQRHRMWLYDTTLAGASIVFDSTDGAANSYGPYPVALPTYLRDSSI